jgi:hypothetical protein
MPNSAKLIFREEDRSFFVQSLIQGIVAVMLKTKRGPYGMGTDLITSVADFEKIYGGVDLNFPGVILANRALSRGAQLRVVKVGHYTTIAQPTTLDAVKAVVDESGPDFAIVTGVIDAFDLIMKYPGADYNNIQVKITAASNGDANAFNLEINHLVDSYLNEKYENLKIPGLPTVANSHYMDDVIAKSTIATIVYKDLSGQVGQLRPTNGTWSCISGTNGGTIVDADYSGDPGGTGVYFLNEFDDFSMFAALDNESTSFANAAAAYANSRQDCQALIHVPNTNDAASEVITFRDGLTVDTRFAMVWTGGLKINNPFITSESPTLYPISELGDVLGIAARSAAEFGPWWSFAGLQRGQVDNALGVVNNFGTGGSANLDQLAQRQVNAVVSINGNIFLKGNFSAQKASSRKSFNNVVQLLIYIKKALRPSLERYLEQPNDFRTFREIYGEVQPFFDSLVGGEKRALVDYDWRGDQFANTDSDLKINNRASLDQGQYKVELWLKEVVSMQEFTLTIISAPSGVSFEDNVN